MKPLFSSKTVDCKSSEVDEHSGKKFILQILLSVAAIEAVMEIIQIARHNPPTTQIHVQ